MRIFHLKPLSTVKKHLNWNMHLGRAFFLTLRTWWGLVCHNKNCIETENFPKIDTLLSTWLSLSLESTVSRWVETTCLSSMTAVVMASAESTTLASSLWRVEERRPESCVDIITGHWASWQEIVVTVLFISSNSSESHSVSLHSETNQNKCQLLVHFKYKNKNILYINNNRILIKLSMIFNQTTLRILTMMKILRGLSITHMN